MDSFGISGKTRDYARTIPVSLQEDPEESVATFSETEASGLSIVWYAGSPVSHHLPKRRWQMAAKRVMDVVLAGLALVALMPLFAIVALLIKLSSKGPVLFRQEREGIDGKPFDVFKFRSMRVEDCDFSGVLQTSKDDPRCTPIGRFIRRTSVDELPQLFNVLRGDMSLVGPRPHVAGMLAAGVPYRTLVPFYDARLSMRPGLTGWAQANGLRGSTVSVTASRARIEHDVAYVQNFSLWLDIKIILMTIRTEFFGGTGS
jgi:exopolysaccharide biosynthesis polyprenyl glycosylphosphotransferase